MANIMGFLFQLLLLTRVNLMFVAMQWYTASDVFIAQVRRDAITSLSLRYTGFVFAVNITSPSGGIL